MTLIHRDRDIQQLLQSAAEVAEFCALNAPNIDVEGAFPSDEFMRIAKSGLLASPLSREHGGLGVGLEPGATLPLLQVLKILGSGNLAVGRIYEGHVNALLLIHLFGSVEQRESCALDVHERNATYAVWNTEADDGVKIVPTGQGRYRLEGAKTFASGAGYVNRPLITGAMPDGGWQMCVVPMEQVAVRIDPSWWQPLGMRASATFKVDFTGVELDQSALIGEPGDYSRQPWFSGGAIRFAAVQLGGAEALIDATRHYLREMGRTDDLYQRTRIGECAIGIESGNLWLRGGAEKQDHYLSTPTDGTLRLFLSYANMTRTAVEAICLDVMRHSERSVGARGLMRPLPFERIIRDLTLYLRQPAPDAALASVGQHTLEQPIPIRDIWTHESS